jgi:hypothetical protein
LINEGVTEDIVAESKRRLTWLESRGAETFFAWYRERTDAAVAPKGASGLPNIPGLPDFAFPPASPGLPSGLAEPVPEPAPATEPAPAPEPSAQKP